MDEDFFKRMAEKDFLARLNGADIENLNDTLGEMVVDVGTENFILGINRIFLLRSAALNELTNVSELLNPVTNKHNLSLDEIKNIMPYLDVIEKCSNIIDKYHRERIRKERG